MVCLMLAHRLRCLHNIEPALGQRRGFAVVSLSLVVPVLVSWPEVAKEGFVTTWACIPKTFLAWQGDLRAQLAPGCRLAGVCMSIWGAK